MQGQQLDINLVVGEYQKRLSEEVSKNIMLSAYVQQLEAKIAELQKTEEQE